MVVKHKMTSRILGVMSGVVLGGVVEVVGSNLARDKYLQHLSAQFIHYIPLRFEPTTLTTPSSTTSDATTCTTETSPKKDVQVALILTTTHAVHVVNWFLFNEYHLSSSQMKA